MARKASPPRTPPAMAPTFVGVAGAGAATVIVGVGRTIVLTAVMVVSIVARPGLVKVVVTAVMVSLGLEVSPLVTVVMKVVV